MKFAAHNDRKPASDSNPKSASVSNRKTATRMDFILGCSKCAYEAHQGLNISTPVSSKSATFRVTTIIP